MADKEETQAGLSLTRGPGNEADISQGSGFRISLRILISSQFKEEFCLIKKLLLHSHAKVIERN